MMSFTGKYKVSFENKLLQTLSYTKSSCVTFKRFLSNLHYSLNIVINAFTYIVILKSASI